MLYGPVKALLGKKILSSWSTLPLYVALAGWPLDLIGSCSLREQQKVSHPKSTHASNSKAAISDLLHFHGCPEAPMCLR